MESGDEDDAFTMGEREWQKMSRDLSKVKAKRAKFSCVVWKYTSL